uniref:Gustatory receptor n=1 Tax=Tetranychus urticae TaxID=32264 RepID=T1KJE9_TETUR
MTSINMQQCFVRNEQLKHYPKVSIASIPSRLLLMISSTSNIYGKCLFGLIMFLPNLYYFYYFLHTSLDAIFSGKLKNFLRFLHGNWIFIVYYFRYNHELVKQINDHWNALQIDFDYETRKYFWTRKAIYRRLTNALYIFLIIFRYGYEFYIWNDRHGIMFYFLLLIWTPIGFVKHFCESCILLDLLTLAETAVRFNLIQLKKLLKKSTKDGKSLNTNAIENIRHKYLSSCRLVEKIDEIISPHLLLMFVDSLISACDLCYNLLYTEQSQVHKCYQIIFNSVILITILVSTVLGIKIHEKSQQSLAIVYKLSLKTNSMRLLSEILLFLNQSEIGFTLGGVFMLTTSSLSTLFSILTTIVFALPTFAK